MQLAAFLYVAMSEHGHHLEKQWTAHILLNKQEQKWGKHWKTLHTGFFKAFPALKVLRELFPVVFGVCLRSMAASSGTQRGVSGCLLNEQWFAFFFSKYVN